MSGLSLQSRPDEIVGQEEAPTIWDLDFRVVERLGLDASEVESFTDRYGHEECFTFAVGLHEATGWPIRAVAEAEQPRLLLHACVVAPSGALVDVYGVFAGQEGEDAIRFRYGIAKSLWSNITADHASVVGRVDPWCLDEARAVIASPWMQAVLSHAGAPEDVLAAAAEGSAASAMRPC